MTIKNKWLKLNIQHFAEPTEPTEPTEPPTEPAEKTFTQKELDSIIEQRLKRAEKDKQAAIDEAAKLAKMNADEKQKYEFEKLQAENEKLKSETVRYAMAKEATTMLSDVGIVADDDLLAFVVKDDADATKQAVRAFSTLVTSRVDAAVKDKLKGTSPKAQVTANNGVTKESIINIKDSVERIKAIQDNPHLFN